MVTRPIISLESGSMPFLKLLIGYLLGIVVAQCFSWNYASVLFISGVTFSLLLLLIIAVFIQLPYKAITFLLYLTWVTLGLMQYGRSLPEAKVDYVADHNFSQLIGDVVEEPTVKKGNIRLLIDLRVGTDSLGKSQQFSGRVLLTVYKDSTTTRLPKYGDQIQFPANVRRVAPPYNPNEFDYRNYLANRGIYHQQRLPADQLCILQSQTNWYTYVLLLKERVVTQFRSNITDQTAFSVAAALVFGYRAEMDPEIYTAFTDTGTIHILSVSGMHVSMVFILLSFVLRPLDRWTYGKSLRFTLVLSFIWLYVVLTGMAPPILRAGIMISFLVLSHWIGRRQHSLNALFASGFCILWYDPKMLFDVGFQLSYLAMLGIFLIFPLLRSLYLPRNRWLRTVFDYSYISIAAQLVTTPLTLYYFGQFPNYFLLANLLITIPATAIMYLGVGLMFLPIPMVAQLLGTLEHVAIHVMVSTLKWIGNLPGATWQGVSYTMPQVMLLFGAVVSIFVAVNYRSKQALYALCVAAFFLVSIAFWQGYQKTNYSSLHVYQLRQHVAIAWYQPGRVVLFSTLDSLEHASIQYAVMPDLISYRTKDQIEFVRISAKQNILLTVDNKQLYVWNEGNYDPPAVAGLVLIRNNRTLTGDHVKQQILYVLDGSNSNDTVAKNVATLQDERADYYTLKDNFAYVWKTK